jgi:hypothetical protein
MTRYQAIRISRMIQNGLTSQEYHDAYRELLKSCSDTEPCPVPTPQPTVTISTNSTAPTPPSTPKPLGPEWWKERQAEAAQEQMEIIKAQAQKIQSLQKQIAEDREHWDKQAVIDKGYREHNDELVAANGEIYEALKHWGLVQSEPCSLVDNVKQVIQLCADRGKAHFDLKDKIERLNDQIDSQSKVIAELTNQRDQWEKLAAKRTGEMNRRSDMIDIMEKQCDQKDKAIKALKATCDIRQGFIDKGLELGNELRNQLVERNAEIEELKKDRNASIIASNQILGALNQTSLRQYDGSLADNVVDVINQCVAQEKKIETLNKEVESKTKVIESLKKSVELLEMVNKTRQQFADTDREVNNRKVEALKLEIQNRKQFSAADRVIDHNKTVEIEALKKQLAVAGKKRQAIVEVGNKLRDRLRIMASQYYMLEEEHVENSNAIALWDDNTTP